MNIKKVTLYLLSISILCAPYTQGRQVYSTSMQKRVQTLKSQLYQTGDLIKDIQKELIVFDRTINARTKWRNKIIEQIKRKLEKESKTVEKKLRPSKVPGLESAAKQLTDEIDLFIKERENAKKTLEELLKKHDNILKQIQETVGKKEKIKKELKEIEVDDWEVVI